MKIDLKHRTLKATHSLCGLVLLLLLAGSSIAQSVPGDSAGITAAVENFHCALAQGDRSSALALLADDVAVLESGGAQTRGEYEREHLGEDIEFARATKTTRSPLKLQQLGDVAWTVATSETTGTFNGRDVNSVGVELMVLTKTPDGWRIRAIHWSSHRK